MVEIKEILEQNPWWRIKQWEEFDRHLLMLKDNPFKINRRRTINIGSVNLVYGPRQVGKTTFLKLEIKKLLEKGITPDEIAYFSCDTLVTNNRKELREAINFLLERNLEYLFIDEISNVRDWGYEIKYFLDAGKFTSLKVFITGSPFGMKEHLPGRKLHSFYLMPLTFREFVLNLAENISSLTKKAFNLKDIESAEIKKISSLLSSLNYTFTNLEDLKKKAKEIEVHYSLLKKLFYSYLLIGGFPSVINNFIWYKAENNRIGLIEEIKTNKERLIDSLKKTGKSEGICFQLLNSVKKRLTSRYSFTQLKETETPLSKETIINYLHHLRGIFLLKIVYAYSFGKGETAYKKSKKIYLLDPFLYHEKRILEGEELLADEEYLSQIVESITAIHLSYLEEDILNPLDTFLFFWYNAKEIDFIFKKKSFFAVEVKFRKKIDKIYKIDQIKNYIILTKGLQKLNKEIFIPVCLFLVLLRNKESYL